MYHGQQITDRLRLVRQLGQGGMGSVWVARHLTLDTEVAVKFTSVAVGATEAGMARFEREARAAAKLTSPHVIKIFDYGRTADGVPFIAMELLPGSDLDYLIQHSLATDQKALPPEFVCRIVEQAARGLEAAHEAGLVHRDIKPENIFVSNVGGEPFVRLLDFGIVKDTAGTSPTLTGTQETVGTPCTMSPEQILHSGQVDFRTDLWSLAVVTYRALTAAWPFDGESAASVFIRIHEGAFAPPSSLRPELPQALDAWFLRALAPDPAHRFSSARELALTFSTALLGRPTSIAVPPTDAKHALTPPRGVPPSDTMAPAISTPRHRREGSRRVVSVVVGTASLALGLGSVSWWLAADPSEPVPAAPAAMPRGVPQPPTRSVTQPIGAASVLPSADPSSASNTRAAASAAASAAAPAPPAASSTAFATPASGGGALSPAPRPPVSPPTDRPTPPPRRPVGPLRPPTTDSCTKYGIGCR